LAGPYAAGSPRTFSHFQLTVLYYYTVYTMRAQSFIFALFLIVSQILLPVTLASPVAPRGLFRRQYCFAANGGCRFEDPPAVADAFQLSSSSTPEPTPLAEPQVAVAASSSAPESTPTPTTGSSNKPNAGVALVSHGKLFFVAFTGMAATVLIL